MLYSLRGNISYFYSISDLEEKHRVAGQRLRIGGIVKKGSVVRKSAEELFFSLTDTKKTISIIYLGGFVPDLFRENQEIVVEGIFREDGIFLAHSLLTKHDENYRPEERKIKT